MLRKKQWFIAKPHNSTEYYVVGIDIRRKAIIWTPRRRDAMKFENLSSAKTYITQYLSNRTDIHVVSLAG